MTAILPLPAGGSTAAKESSCWLARETRGPVVPGGSNASRDGGTVISGPGRTTEDLFRTAGTWTVVFRYIV
jgi:hypothetical protein